MPITIAVTRNVPGRFRGFLASCMLEAAPGVYLEPDMPAGVRDRVWKVMVEWVGLIPSDGGVALFWGEPEAPSGLGVEMLGWPKAELTNHDGIWLSRKPLTRQHALGELQALAEGAETYSKGADDPPSDQRCAPPQTEKNE